MAKSKRTKTKKSDLPAAGADNLILEPETAVADSKITVRRNEGKVVVSIPVKFYRRNGRQMVLAQNDATGNPQTTPSPNHTLITNLAKAYHWQQQLESGEYGSLEELARANKVDRTHISRILQLTSLSPTIVEQILAGDEPFGISLRQFRKGIQVLWSEQSDSSH